MRKFIQEIREALRQLDLGLCTETQFIDKSIEAMQSFDEQEYASIKEEENRRGIVTLACLYVDNHMPLATRDELREVRRQLESSLDWLHAQGYKCWADEGMQFHAEKDTQKFVSLDPRIYINAKNHLAGE